MRFQTCPWLGGPFLTWGDLSMSWGSRCSHWTQGLVLVFVLNPSVRLKCSFCYHSSGNQIKCCTCIHSNFGGVLNCLCSVQIECGAVSPAKNSLNPSGFSPCSTLATAGPHFWEATLCIFVFFFSFAQTFVPSFFLKPNSVCNELKTVPWPSEIFICTLEKKKQVRMAG